MSVVHDVHGIPVLTIFCCGDYDDNAQTKCPQRAFDGRPIPNIGCAYGLILDKNGCSTFECAEDPASGKRDPRHSTPVFCDEWCEYGFRQDVRGYYICECRNKCKPTPIPMCAGNCEFRHEKDADGCDVYRCECKKPGPMDVLQL